MKHLMKLVTEKPTKHFKPRREYPSKCFHDNSKYICYMINGYCFRLNHAQWARFRGIKANTLTARLREGRSLKQVLGYEKIVHRKHTGKSESTKYSNMIKRGGNER